MAALATAPSPIATHRYNGTDYAMQFIASRAVLVVKADGTDYTVTLDDARTPIACTCLGFHYRHACRHLNMVGKLVDRGAFADPIVETVACDVCGEPTDPAVLESWPTRDGGRRPVCTSCVDDLLVHGVPDAPTQEEGSSDE